MNQNTKSALLLHRKLIKQKGILHKIYIDFYNQFKLVNFPKGKVVELGSGGGFIKEIIPDTITTDLLKAPGINKIVSATDLPFPNKTISGYLMIDVLHHIKDGEKAFMEMERTLKVGGKIIMIEPFNCLWGQLIYRFSHYERFDPKASWKVKGEGRMSDSNTALPWIIFIRDRKVFEKKFPSLKIIKIYPHSPFKYLFSGGLTKYQFLPTFTYPLIRWFDDFISRLFPQISMFVTIELEKLQK